MGLAITSERVMNCEEQSVHDWRVLQLMRLGISDVLAEIYADHIDWHQIARLVQHGCPPRLALRIAHLPGAGSTECDDCTRELA